MADVGLNTIEKDILGQIRVRTHLAGWLMRMKTKEDLGISTVKSPVSKLYAIVVGFALTVTLRRLPLRLAMKLKSRIDCWTIWAWILAMPKVSFLEP
jgi:hypothetical protein